MWRVLSRMVVAFALIVSAAGCTSSSPSAAPSSPSKAETPGPAVAKSGGQVAQAGPGGQGAPSGQSAPGGQARQAAARVVTVASVTQGSVNLIFTYTGTAQPRSQVNLAPRTSGRIEQLLVDVGSEVKAGDPIAILERGALQLAVQQAEANLSSAQARLTTVQSGGRPEDITSAQAALSSALARLNQVRSGATASDLQTAQTAVDTSRANLASAQARLEVVKAGSTSADLGSAQAGVDTAKATVRSTEARLAQVRSGPTTADLQKAQSTVADAKSKMMSAQDVYEIANSDGGLERLKTNNGVSYYAQQYQTAQAAFDAAVQALNQLIAGPTVSDLQTVQSAYDSARASLDSATARLDQMLRGPTPQDVQQAQSTVDSATASVAAAEVRLAQLKNGPTDDDLTIAQASVTQAQQTLALRQQPYTAQDVLTAQATVDVAKVSLITAQTNFGDATVVAPFSGIITAKLLSPGAITATQTPIVTLISSDLEIPVNIEESRLSRLKPGLPVSLRVSSYPGESFQAKVSAIAPSADARSHTFLMKVIPGDTAGKLKPGMFVELRVTAEEHSGALMVPTEAIIQRNSKDVVFVVDNGVARMREVVQGLPQDGNVELVSGVKVGEQVIVVGQSGLFDGNPVRLASAAGDQQPEQQQQRPGAPGKTP